MTSPQIRSRRPETSSSKPAIASNDQRAQRKRLFTWNEIPAWQRDNDYILSGYRGELGSWKKCLDSAFTYLHNETVNIQSHYIGGAIFIAVWLYHLEQTYVEHKETLNGVDKLFMTFFMVGALVCLFLSGSYHMMSCHSKPVADVFHRLDYAGIVILTVGSFYPAVYYGFYCEPLYARFWLALLTLAGASASYAVLSPTYSTPAYRRTRAYLFIALGLGGALPILHLFILEGYERPYELGVKWLFASAALYIGGAILYSERFPERVWPGRFDIFFASHQIFHVCVVLAALCHYMAMMQSIAFWHGTHDGTCKAFAN